MTKVQDLKFGDIIENVGIVRSVTITGDQVRVHLSHRFVNPYTNTKPTSKKVMFYVGESI